MAKLCKTCGRPNTAEFHKETPFGMLCDMVTLSNGHIVARQRIELDGDLHDQLGDDLKVVKRWIKD